MGTERRRSDPPPSGPLRWDSSRWSDRPDDRARHSLRQCVLTLRKVLGREAESALLADDEGLSLDAADVEVDALAFEQAVAARAMFRPSFTHTSRASVSRS